MRQHFLTVFFVCLFFVNGVKATMMYCMIQEQVRERGLSLSVLNIQKQEKKLNDEKKMLKKSTEINEVSSTKKMPRSW